MCKLRSHNLGYVKKVEKPLFLRGQSVQLIDKIFAHLPTPVIGKVLPGVGVQFETDTIGG